ncbi:MAG TPA: nicotinate-nucleotide--dimethylbenzimidazole phosphoribosyltransferase [Puia sp.]|nr:nicotinate-nucleotide--dimethylbenzimidazole phosphoribosyltransferase [Puia sp.]
MSASVITGTTLQKELQHRIDNKTKPPGALGRLEEIALQAGLIQQTLHPVIRNPHIVVFAGDHGIAAGGLVNPFPQAVTAQMVLNFINGGAAINVFCRQHDIRLVVVDAGVNFDFGTAAPAEKLVHAKIGYGTRDYLKEEAMSRDQVGQAMEEGKKIVTSIFHTGCNFVGFGEMGIGNTSSASLIMSFVTGIPIEECVGRGTGSSDEQLKKKIVTLGQAYRLHFDGIAQSQPAEDRDIRPGSPDSIPQPDPLKILQRVGGFEIAMMAGAYLKAAELKMIIAVDGFIATAALLTARAIDPDVQKNCIFAHTSGEQGHEKMLRWLGARPLLDLGMRLGEGTGAAMAFPVIQSALHFLNEMASFESAGVSR